MPKTLESQLFTDEEIKDMIESSEQQAKEFEKQVENFFSDRGKPCACLLENTKDIN